ncbi:MAG: glycine zipper family protein [Deltaproteobacteria bacterium HGW-Deltaproteobacteria-13]|nr:MAG: glycine zipper family protein [Deltaproteobacteria bacterium HGW-Deltaproteobacteria-13]
MNIKILKKISYLAKHGSKLLLLPAILLLSSCYYYPQEQIVTQPAQDQNITAITQIYFYPNKGQSTEQQSRDHYACYGWAVDQTGFDPSESSIAPEQRVRVVPMPPPGHDTISMSIAGAVLGALIGGYHHSGQGALIGAAGGAMAGMISDASRAEAARQMEEAYQNRHQGRDLHKEKKALQFRRAMSACMEGRGYTVQ